MKTGRQAGAWIQDVKSGQKAMQATAAPIQNGEANLKRKQEREFTLIELLVVLAIVALLTALVGPACTSAMKPARATVAKAQIQNIAKALDAFYIDNGRFPSNPRVLQALREKPSWSKNWKGPYLERELPVDPWARPYYYKTPGRNGGYEVWSLGADGKEGGEDEDADVGSWQ